MKKTNGILDYISQFSLEDVLSGIIEMQILLYGSDVDSLLPASEYLATNALFACKQEGNRRFEWADYLQLETYCKNFFAPSIDQFLLEALSLVNANEKEKEEYLKSLHMRLKNTAFRGDGYLHQLMYFANKLYAPLDQEIKNKLGFTFTSCEKMIIHINHVYCERIEKVYREKNKVKNVLKTFCKRERLQLPSIKAGYIYRIDKTDLHEIIDQDEVNSICNYLCVKAYEGSFKEVENDEFKILLSKPFVDFGDYIYMPLLLPTLMNLPKLFHYTFIAEKIFDKDVMGVYTKYRGNLVEDFALQCFKRLVPEENIFKSLQYKDASGEADVTVCRPEGSLFCECKSKILTLNALKGINESIKEDVYKAIGMAYNQAVRSIKYVQDGKAFIVCENGVEQEIYIDNTDEKYIVCLTAENFGMIPSEITKYIELDKEVCIIPYAVNIFDLDIITQECNSYNEFLGYLHFRQNNFDILSAVDELDIFGYYKMYGDIKIEIDGDELHIMDCTKQFDRKYYKKDKEYLQRCR